MGDQYYHVKFFDHSHSPRFYSQSLYQTVFWETFQFNKRRMPCKRRVRKRNKKFTLSLCSRLLTITAVICWSIKTRIVVSKAGIQAAIMVHQGFLPSGWMIQPLASDLVGSKFWGIFNFGVAIFRAKSTPTIIITDIITAKSETTLRTYNKMEAASESMITCTRALIGWVSKHDKMSRHVLPQTWL